MRVVCNVPKNERAQFWVRLLQEQGISPEAQVVESKNDFPSYRVVVADERLADARDFIRGFQAGLRQLSDMKAFVRGLLLAAEALESNPALLRSATYAGLYKPHKAAAGKVA